VLNEGRKIMTDLLTVQNITIFVLAIFVGYHVVWNVTSALHTPLMSVTNAISGIVIVGAILQVVEIEGDTFTLTSILGAFAIFFASINIFGGFFVTQRMLEMFKKKEVKNKKDVTNND
jgi:NAD(P) transhydrogenase subunit alpha